MPEKVTLNQVQLGIFAEAALTETLGGSTRPILGQYTINHYAKLVGRKITSICFQSFDGQPLPILVLDDGSTAPVLADPEGNGPGHLDIQPPGA